MTVEKTALLVGGTGLVGGHCLRLLVQQTAYTRVVALLRRPAPLEHPRLVQRLVDFDNLDGAEFAGVTDLFCALGTTIAKAGSEEAFYKIDYGYPITIARLAEKAGVKQLVLVSSVGADPRSTSFYLRVKGELEQEISAGSFEALHILRPSLLLGERGEVRKGEAIGVAAAQTLRFTMKGGLRRYRPIDAKTVAGAMVAAALRGEKGRHIYHFDDMESLAASLGPS